MELAKTVLKPAQMDVVNQIVTALRDGHQTLLGHVETERARLTSRDAEERSAALNELCAIILQLLPKKDTDKVRNGANMGCANTDSAITRAQIEQLLSFLLSKVEDCGHMSDMLITTLHQMIKVYDGTDLVLPNECLDQTITALFDGGGSVQSYGQRDRLLLFSVLDHLVATHGPLLRSLLGSQRMLLAFINAAKNEREPHALARMFVLHQRMSANFSMGVLSEDMFELVACYFPIDYEPSDQELTEPMPITREQLEHACECALLGHVAFAPYCMQLIAEKLLETEGDADQLQGRNGEDNSTSVALIRRQLEISQFFICACTKFYDAPNCAVHEHVDDLMTAVRLLFLNPAVKQYESTLLEDIRTTVEQMLRLLASMLAHNAVKLEDPSRFIRLMAETTLENVEPFVLQAELGSAGRAFCLLRCVALSHPLTCALCVPRALYWLTTLMRGQTLRSANNMAEIATEALAFVPEWLRLCFVGHLDDNDVCIISGDASHGEQLISATVVPLFDAMRSLQSVCEPDTLLAAECEAHSILLLALDTVPSAAAAVASPSNMPSTSVGQSLPQVLNEQQIAQLRTLCASMANRVLPLLTATQTFDDSDDSDVLIRNVVQQQTNNAKWVQLSKSLKQFIALGAHLTSIGDRIDAKSEEHKLVLPDPKQWSRLLELVPALLHPLPAELEQHEMLQKPLAYDEKFTVVIGSLLLSTISGTDSTIVEECAFDGLHEMAQRLALVAWHKGEGEDGTRRDGFAIFATQQLINFIADFVHNDDQMETEWHRRADRFAQLLQHIGTLAMARSNSNCNNCLSELMCVQGLHICQQQKQLFEKDGDAILPTPLLRALRCFWLLFLTTAQKNMLALEQFFNLLLDTLTNAVVVGTFSFSTSTTTTSASHQQQESTCNWLIDAILCVHFALINNNLLENAISNDGTGKTADLPLPMHITFDKILPDVLDSSTRSSLEFRLHAVETRNVLLEEPNAAIVTERLKQFFNTFMALNDADSATIGIPAIGDLLDLCRPSTCPEQCKYRRTMFWRQRLFCQFVPVFVQFARSPTCSSTKRRVMLQLLGPLLKIVAPQHISMDIVLYEFAQLYPVIVDALVDALLLSPQKTPSIGPPPIAPVEQLSSSEASLAQTAQSLPLLALLDALCTLLEQMPPGSQHFVALVPRLVHALTANIAAHSLIVQSKALECLRLLALPRLAIPPEALLPLHVSILRIGLHLALSPKRLIRQRMARARNAWELALA